MKTLTMYINEVSGWKLDDEDWVWVNTEEDGKDLYAVRLWWGSGYLLDAYAAYADDEEQALNYTVAWLEKNNAKLLDTTDKDAHALLDELEKDGIEEPDTSAEFEETYMYVDATMEGADEPHYVYSENMRIEKFPKNKIPKH